MFRNFTEGDWCAFAGCESRDPQICDDLENCTMIIDDGRLEVYMQVENGDEFDSLVGNWLRLKWPGSWAMQSTTSSSNYSFAAK
jgi:hypothetical protein